jgi:hypothetical protein
VSAKAPSVSVRLLACPAYGGCNPFAADPPVSGDGQGACHDRLTVGPGRNDGPSMDEVRAWIEACAL